MKIGNIWCLLAWGLGRKRPDLAGCYKALSHITPATQHVPMCLITHTKGFKSTTLEGEWGKGEALQFQSPEVLVTLTPFLLASLPQLPFSYIQLYSFSASLVRMVTEGAVSEFVNQMLSLSPF